MTVWFTIGIPVNGGIDKFVPWGEPHVSEDLAELDARIGNKRYKDIRVMEFKIPRTKSAYEVFNELKRTGIEIK